MSRSRIVGTIFFSLFVVFAVIVCVFAFKSDLWEIDNPMERCILLDSGWKQIPQQDSSLEKVVLERVFTPDDFHGFQGGPTLFFCTLNMRVRVFVDGYRMYSFGNNGRRYVGSESGTSLHFIRLSHSFTEPFTVSVQLAPCFQGIHRQIIVPDMYLGSKSACIEKYFYSCMIPSGLLSIAIILVGFVGLFSSIAFWISRRQFISEYFYWGLFSIVTGFGFLLESGAADLIVPNSFFQYFILTLVLAASPAFFLVYVKQSKTLPYNKKVSRVFGFGSCIGCICVCIFAFIKTVPFSYVKSAVIIFQIAFLFFVIAIIISEAVSFAGRLSFVNALLILASASLVADLTLNLFSLYPVDSFKFSRPCFFVFLIVRSVCVINDFYNVQILTARKEMFEDAVTRDILTGTRTRPAFWKAQRDIACDTKHDISCVSLVLCEIVNLKAINEKRGFEAGDDALREVARLLQQNFPLKDIYRFDGSVFSILLTDFSDEVIGRKIDNTKAVIEEYNRRKIEGQIELCFGKCRYDSKKDGGFDQFLTRTQVALCQNRLEIQKKS